MPIGQFKIYGILEHPLNIHGCYTSNNYVPNMDPNMEPGAKVDR